MPTKSDSDEIFSLQLLSKTLTCTLKLSLRESRDHLYINPILRIGLINKWSNDSKSLITLWTKHVVTVTLGWQDSIQRAILPCGSQKHKQNTSIIFAPSQQFRVPFLYLFHKLIYVNIFLDLGSRGRTKKQKKAKMTSWLVIFRTFFQSFF